ncbi:MAG TPA: hypothetical protein VNF99_05345 [Stellaceae bacterium]|nr:hypothetical protein [Stellaceae bacterium]
MAKRYLVERRIHCPETEDECANPACSIKVCAIRIKRPIHDQRPADQHARSPKEASRQAHYGRSLWERAARQLAREKIAKHNALIDKGQPGILPNRRGEIDNERIALPESGLGSKTSREMYVTHVLFSENPETIAQVARALRAADSQHDYGTLGEIAAKLRMLRVECDRCGRTRRYKTDKLIAKYGAGASIQPFQDDFTRDCPRRDDSMFELGKGCTPLCPDLSNL